MEVIEAIKARRSIRKYKPIPVPDNLLETVLEAARQAPSWENVQCWRFIVVRDENLKNQLADSLDPTNPAIRAVKQAPLLIVSCAEIKKSGFHDTEACTDKGDWCMFDVALAMQNMALAATSLGLGTVHVGLFDAKKVVGILKVPDNFCVVEMMPLGYPDQEPKMRPRKELGEIIYYNQFGVNA